jgi:hypothetical protein
MMTVFLNILFKLYIPAFVADVGRQSAYIQSKRTNKVLCDWLQF